MCVDLDRPDPSPHLTVPLNHQRTHARTGFLYQLYTGDWLSWKELAFGYVHSYWRFIMGWGACHILL